LNLLFPEIEVNMWWTNLLCKAETAIGLYHSHATNLLLEYSVIVSNVVVTPTENVHTASVDGAEIQYYRISVDR